MKNKTSVNGKDLNSSDNKIGTNPFQLKSTTPAGISICIIIPKWSGHPSFKKEGKCIMHIFSTLSGG